MSGNQQQSTANNVGRLWSWIGGALLVVGICLVARFLIGPAAAQAQANRGATQAKNRTKARPTAATRVANKNAAKTPAPPADANRAVTAPAAEKPNVVAIVNGEAMSRDELGTECLRRFGKDVLESVVNKQLIAYECKKRNIVITEKDINDEITRMATKFGLSTDRYLLMLQQERNINLEEYQREIIWPMLALKRLAADQIQVTEADLRAAFESEYGPKVKARIIVTGTREKAQLLHSQAKADPSKFGELAKNHSEDVNSAAARGLVPPIRKNSGDEKMEKIAFGLKDGEISEIIPIADKFVILKCDSKIGETFVPAQSLPEIENRLRETIADQKLREAATEMFRRLQEETKVVNVMNDPELSRKMPGVAATINGRPIQLKEVAEACIQRNGQEVLEGEVNRRILLHELKSKGIKVENQDLDEEIRRAADAYGFLKTDGSPDVERWLKHVTEEGGESATVDLYVRDAVWPSVALKKLVAESIEISEEEMQKGFEANYGERVEVLAIVCPNERRANQVWDMARQNPSDEYFGELASQYSIEPVSRANAGRVPPIRRHGGSSALEDKAFELQPGETSGIVIVGDKHIILRCLGRTVPRVKSVDEVRDELHKHLHEAKLRMKMTEEFDRLKETAKVQTFLPDAITRNGPAADIKPAARVAGNRESGN